MKTLINVLLLLTCSCVPLRTLQYRESQADDIYEALFRHHLMFDPSEGRVLFLAVGEGEGDPSDELIKRFATRRPAVRKVSACRLAQDQTPVDRTTGERGTRLSAGGITWISETEVQVGLSCQKGFLWGFGESVTLIKEGGKWMVARAKSAYTS